MRVLANDGLNPEGVRLFTEAGFEIDTSSRDRDALIEVIGKYDALIVRSRTRVDREVIEAGRERLKIIGRAGVGYDNIDVEAASENGIVVKFAPHGNTNSTAELALALMLNISRKVPQAHYSLKNSVWKKKPFTGEELSGKVLGIVGCGRIGQRLAQLVRGFDMKVIGYDPHPRPDSRIEYVPLDDLLRRADFVSIHAGGKECIIGPKELEKMKPTAYLINTSRGRNVDEDALYAALKEGRIAGAGLDTYVDEPGGEGAVFDKRLRELDNVVLSAHLGASTREAQAKTGVEIAQVIIGFLTRGDWHNAVNVGEEVDVGERPTFPVFIFHNDKPGVFVHIDEVFARYDINIREISGRKFSGKDTAAAVYLVEKAPSPEVLDALAALPDVLCVKR